MWRLADFCSSSENFNFKGTREEYFEILSEKKANFFEVVRKNVVFVDGPPNGYWANKVTNKSTIMLILFVLTSWFWINIVIVKYCDSVANMFATSLNLAMVFGKRCVCVWLYSEKSSKTKTKTKVSCPNIQWPFS